MDATGVEWRVSARQTKAILGLPRRQPSTRYRRSFQGCYAASLGMARSTNRKNRELRAPATDRQPDVKLGVSDRSQGRFLLRGHATPDPGEMEAKTRTAPFPERRRWYRKNRWLRGPATAETDIRLSSTYSRRSAICIGSLRRLAVSVMWERAPSCFYITIFCLMADPVRQGECGCACRL